MGADYQSDPGDPAQEAKVTALVRITSGRMSHFNTKTSYDPIPSSCSEVPQCSKRMQPCRPASTHHLIISLHVRRNKNDLGSKSRPRVLQQCHRIGATATLLRVPKDHALRLNVFLDQARNGRPKSLLLVRSNPDEEPVFALYAG